MSADPTRTLLSMDLLDDDDHDRLDEWGNRAVLTEPAAEPVSIPVVFAVQVERAPETVALVCRDRSWTYRELDQITNLAEAGRYRRPDCRFCGTGQQRAAV
ncbi:hypothetical protein [Mycobacteroides abscessus]|uniref:hypothetical protein n=1 Tax=Mycobacteroides abscessus TaxID=36809 RepID=UPI00092600A7|nr:hypothetical protein [Mycobacteroides abscessus]SID26507.1 Probable peptide synthetase NRP [Mycobacteroides abscessus subsp. abscessus]